MKLTWQILNSLEKRFGPAFYLYDAAAFKANYLEFLTAFKQYYHTTAIAYSYKTNYLPRLCRQVDKLGGYAEVVSGMEYDLAVKIGVPPAKIIFNGPYKSPADLKKALLDGALVNLDSEAEADMIKAVARLPGNRPLRVGLRCNFDFQLHGPSRFGIDAAGRDLKAAIARLRTIKSCRIEGLHCHFLPPKRGAETYGLIARRMAELGQECLGEPPKFLDLGGGFFSKMPQALAAQFEPPIPVFADYAREIGTQMALVYSDHGPELILEPGLALAADTMDFIAKITALKTIGKESYAVLTGSLHNIKPTKSPRELPFKIFHSPGKSESRQASLWNFVGYTCMEDDYLLRKHHASLAVGDYVLFENVGAYTIVLKPPFIFPAPPILGWSDELQNFEVLRRQETFADVFSTYNFNPPDKA